MNLLLLLLLLHQTTCLIPPKFQWKTVDFTWKGQSKEAALCGGDYIPKNIMPTGIARWKDKLFITIPRWKTGVPSSLNYVRLNGSQSPPLQPYPSWAEGFLSHQQCCPTYNSTVVNAFSSHVDECDRLWVVDNGISNMEKNIKKISTPAILIFDLNCDELYHKHELEDHVLRHNSVLTSVVVDKPVGKTCCKSKESSTYAYIMDTGSGGIIVYDFDEDECWRVDNPHLLEISGAALSQKKSDGFRDLYFISYSKLEQFKISTKFLKDKYIDGIDLFEAVEVNKNGIGCWNANNPYNEENAPIIFSDCNIMEYPKDVQVDSEGNIWILSNRQARFLSNSMDFSEVNFRVFTAPVANFIQGTPCDKQKSKWFKKKQST